MSRPHSPLYWRTHLAILAGAALVFFLAYLEASRHAVPVWELDATDEINEAPAWIAHALWPIMQLGTVWAPIVIGIVVAAVYGPRRGAAVVISGLSAWFLTKFVKHLVERGRPLAYLPNINVREGSGGGLGFVSGHTAVAFAVATALLPILPPKGRVVAYSLATMVGLARIVYGAHLVVDVIGGAALGIMCGCVVDLLFKVVPSRHPSGVASA
jgi:membrane-associated phospholipid phosphatase